MKTVDIVIPYYFMNKRIAKYLCDCLDYQDYKDYMKVYFISDCSYDEKPLEDELKNVTFNYELLSTGLPEKSGPGKAKNIGLDHCTGDIVLFWDADDYMIGKDCVSKVINCFTDCIKVVRLSLVHSGFSGITKSCVAIDKSIITKYNFKFPEISFSEDIYFDMFIDYIMRKEYKNSPALYFNGKLVIGIWNLPNANENLHIFGSSSRDDAHELDSKLFLARGILYWLFIFRLKRYDSEFNAEVITLPTPPDKLDIDHLQYAEIDSFCIKYYLEEACNKDALMQVLNDICTRHKDMIRLIELFKKELL